MEWILSGGILQYSLRVPMPPSIRNMNARQQREWFRVQVVGAFSGGSFDEAEYAIQLDYYSAWYTKKEKIRRKDLANLLSHMSDDVAEGLGIDDKCWFHIAMSKRPKEEEEDWVNVKIYSSG